MKNIILTTFLFLILVSCSNQNKVIEKELMSCVNESVNKEIVAIFGESKEKINVYNLMKDVENIFISKQLINNINKDGYIDAIESIQSNEKFNMHKSIFEESIKMMEVYGFDFNSYTNSLNILSICPSKVLSANENNIETSFKNQTKVLLDLEKSGYYDEELFKQLVLGVENDDFDNIVYRTPIILIILKNLEYKIKGTRHKVQFY